MRRWLLWLAITGCFSEGSDPPSECTPGDPGCDCASDGSCTEGNECVAAIDKCVPTDCTPGSRTCTCADGNECLGMLMCREGVCLDPPPETTGDPTNASSSPSTTDATVTGPMTSSPGTDTVTDTSMPTGTGSATESSVDTTNDDADTGNPSTTSTGSETGTVDCVQCLIDASTNMDCATTFANCSNDTDGDGCGGIYECVIDHEGTPQECCDLHNGTMSGHLLWAAFTNCAQDNDCMQACFFTCPV
jgi:hypothetical protein